MTDISDISDEILSKLGDRVEEAKSETKTEEVVPSVTLESTDWVYESEEIRSRFVPFSELFNVKCVEGIPDHLVKVFDGYDSDDIPMYIPDVKVLQMLSLALSLGKFPNLIGPTGCGKTLIYEFYAAMTGRPYLRIAHNAELDKSSVFGQIHITDGDTGFVPGDFVKSANSATLVLLDELTRAPGWANMMYGPTYDRREILIPEMKEAGATKVIPNHDWLLCAADNTKGDGEDMDKYPMSNVQDSAFRNRFDLMLEVDYLSPRQETDLIQQFSERMTAAVASKLAKVSATLHKMFKDGDINTAFSPRQLKNIADYYDIGVDIHQAIEMAYTSFCSKSEASSVNEVVRSIFGSK